MYRIYVVFGGDPSVDETYKEESPGSLLFVGGKVALTAKHFDEHIDALAREFPDYPVQIWLKRYDQAGEKYECKVLWSEINKFPMANEHKTIWVFNTNKIYPKANMIKKLPSRKNEKLVTLLYSSKLSGRFVLRERVGTTSYNSIVTEFLPIRNKIPHPNHELDDVIYMAGTTKFGDCGAIGISTDVRLKDADHNTVLIMYGHQAAFGGKPIGYRIWQEDFLDFELGNISEFASVNLFENQLDVAMAEFAMVSGEVVYQKVTSQNLPLPDHMTPVGKAIPFNQVNMTTLRKSPFYTGMKQWHPVEKYPSELKSMIDKDGILHDPFYNARLHYCTGDATTNQIALNEISDFVFTWLVSKSSSFENPRVLSFEEAVKGVPSLNLPAIKRSTSPGYRFNMQKQEAGIKDGGKYFWFGDEPEISILSDECKKLEKLVGERIKQAEDGDRLYTIFMDCLKEERLALEKIVDFSTRLFCCCELDFLIICKMYLGHFCAWVVDNRIQNSVCVGINPHGDEWQRLCEKMSSFGHDRVIAGDFSKYDKKILMEFIAAFFNIVENYYRATDSKESQVRKIIGVEFMNSMHVAMINGEAWVYEWLGANTSGNGVTSIMNCIINLLMCLYVICDILLPQGIMKYRGEGLPLKFIMNNLIVETYGDDNLLSPSQSLDIDQAKMTTHFQRCLGMKYTDELKTGTTFGLRSIYDVSFLSRRFRKEMVHGCHVIVAPLKLVSVIEAPMWVHRGYKLVDLEQCLLNSIKELAYHGKEVFDKLAPLLIKEGESLGLEMSIRSWDVAIVAARSMDYSYNL